MCHPHVPCSNHASQIDPAFVALWENMICKAVKKLRLRPDSKEEVKSIALYRWVRSEKLRALPPSPRLARRVVSKALAEHFRVRFGKAKSESMKQRTANSTDAIWNVPAEESARDIDGLLDLAEALRTTLPTVVSDVRAMFELVYVDGFSISEVARGAGVPWATLHDQFSRIRQAIRESLRIEDSDR